MKSSILIILLSLSTISEIKATSYSHTDTVKKVVTIPSGQDKDYITLNNFTSAGNCLNAHGVVVAKFSASHDRVFSLAIAAKMANKKVRLIVDDAIKNSEGFCLVKALELE
ncbi:hypothetical protein AWH60_11310 [Pseudoalteromonas haloplanktis]|nr:hypothetical protein AWH60_11310 [Pseudoalteromonas haloplanktis]